MHSTSTSLKLAAGALAVALAVLGLTGCGSRGGGNTRQMFAPSTNSGNSSAQFDVGHTVE